MKYLVFILITVLVIAVLFYDKDKQKTLEQTNIKELQNQGRSSNYQNDKDARLDFTSDKIDSGYSDIESFQSEECLELKRNSPYLLKEYYELMDKHGLAQEDLLKETSYNNLPVQSLIQLAESGDFKAQYILGIYYVWMGGTGINYFKDLNEETRDESIDITNITKNHQLDSRMVSKGQNLLLEAAVNDKFFALQEIAIGQRFKLKKLFDEKNYQGFQEEFIKYLEVSELINFVFTNNAKKVLDESYYRKDIIIAQLNEMYPDMMKGIELPAYRRDSDISILAEWRNRRFEDGYLSLHFDIDIDMAPFAEKMQAHCWGI